MVSSSGQAAWAKRRPSHVASVRQLGPITLFTPTVGWSIVSAFLFAAMGAFVRLASAHHDAAELVMYRGMVGAALLYVWLRRRGRGLATPHWRNHLYRSLAGSTSLLLFFYAFAHLSLATAITLNYTSAIFLAILLPALHREPVRGQVVLFVGLGFCGVAMLLRPSLPPVHMLGAACGLASGVGASLAYLNLKRLGELREPEWRTVFYFSLMCMAFGACAALGRGFHPIDSASASLILAIGVSALLAQLAMTRAYALGPPLVAASWAYSTVIFASIIGYAMWREMLGPDAWLAVGLIVVSGVGSSALERTPAARAAR